MRYKLIDKYKILQVINVIDSVHGLITNATDEIIDSHNAGKPLDETATPPEYNIDTQELKTVYIETDSEIIKGYEISDIIPNEINKLSDKIDIVKQRVTATENTVLDLLMGGGV